MCSLAAFGTPSGLPRHDSSRAVAGPVAGDLEDLRKGDCFSTVDDLTAYPDKDADKDGAPASRSVRVMPCAQPHEGEVYGVFSLGSGPFPGKEKIASLVDEKCSAKALANYLGAEANPPKKMRAYTYFPTPGAWDLGFHQVVCFVGVPTGTTTGSVRAPGS
ncbi:septum formation family protein [Streptomyces sp. NPDC127106]|uniref:septum formation family protein n=1 Tax=Streptomyces sp. NPDC127106 TaxID=3345360 RepID=UPI003642A08B